ncbi:hypothetical protein [Nocardia rhizosphaerae]|uniref:Uncharacterized protein n=1 Tax=Nocardia rhizosphaerae TaxID=1691571 RepID=A0ABV8LDX8_9NOCA
MSPVNARPSDPAVITAQLREEVLALAHDLRWDGHADHAARAEAIADKCGVTDAAA